MSDEQTPVPVEVTITARDARGNTASHDFEYTPSVGPSGRPAVEEAVDDLIHGWIGRIDQRIKPVDSGK